MLPHLVSKHNNLFLALFFCFSNFGYSRVNYSVALGKRLYVTYDLHLGVLRREGRLALLFAILCWVVHGEAIHSVT